MKIEFLGTGGATTIPRPLCQCRVCKEAREKGVPYSRMGPSLFVHGPNMLFDTPEEIVYQIERSSISTIEGVIYSHWHPDHVMGRRVLESLNADWCGWPSKPSQTDVYVPEKVAADFRTWLGTWDHLQYFKQQRFIQLYELKDGEKIHKNGVHIRPFRLAEDYVYAFELTEGDKRVLIAMDELNGWMPPNELQEVDVAVLPIGLFDVHPLTNERLIPADHPVLNMECTFEETVAIIEQLRPKKVVLTHHEEMNGLSHDELQTVAKRLQKDDLAVEIAYDTMMVEV
jgi:phosphoribosyl 1,2-cyclic phosphate phosphodiesterase